MKDSGDEFDVLRTWEEYEKSNIDLEQLVDKVYMFCRRHPMEREKVLTVLEKHPDQRIREFGERAREGIRLAEIHVKDVADIRRSSPLHNGVHIRLFDGYDGTDSWWLTNSESYGARFIDFLHAGIYKMPVALVTFDHEFDITHPLGLRFYGRFGLLRLRHFADWSDAGIVEVYVIDSQPEDVSSFFGSNRFDKMIESAASYRIEYVGSPHRFS
jgi:hypothetical protein